MFYIFLFFNSHFLLFAFDNFLLNDDDVAHSPRVFCDAAVRRSMPGSARNGYPDNRVPVSIPVTRVPGRYPGTRVSLNTRVIYSQS